MIIMLFWLMLIGSIVSEIAIAFAWPAYRRAAAANLWINLGGSIVIALAWAIIGTVAGGGGGFTAMLLPVTMPIATVATIPFYHVMAWYDRNRNIFPDMVRRVRETWTGFIAILKFVLFPVRLLGKTLIWIGTR